MNGLVMSALSPLRGCGSDYCIGTPRLAPGANFLRPLRGLGICASLVQIMSVQSHGSKTRMKRPESVLGLARRSECRSSFDYDRIRDLRSGQAFDSVATATSVRVTKLKVGHRATTCKWTDCDFFDTKKAAVSDRLRRMHL
jgi:hypothetical protein